MFDDFYLTYQLGEFETVMVHYWTKNGRFYEQSQTGRVKRISESAYKTAYEILLDA